MSFRQSTLLRFAKQPTANDNEIIRPQDGVLKINTIPKPTRTFPPVSSNSEIKDSDDESSGDGSDGSDLDDLSKVFQTKSFTPNVSFGSTVQSSPPVLASASISVFQSARDRRETLAKAKNKYKLNISDLAASAHKNDEAEEGVKRIQTLLEERRKEADVSVAESTDTKSLLEGMIIDGEEQNAERVLAAVQRGEEAEGLQWHFFDGRARQKTFGTPREFPKSLVRKSWHMQLVHREDRMQMVRTGFARDMVAMQGGVHKELFMWMLEEIFAQDKDAQLRDGYCQILLAAPQQTALFLDGETILGLFEKIGATKSATDRAHGIRPSTKREYEEDEIPFEVLKTLVRFLGDAAPHMLPTTSISSLHVLLRLCADRIVWDRVDVLAIVQRAMIQLVSSASADEAWVRSWTEYLQPLCSSVTTNAIRLQILRCIPAHDPQLALVRARLALATFADDTSVFAKQLTDIDIYNLALVRLRSPELSVTSETDFVELAATITMLDIALTGLLLLNFQNSVSGDQAAFDAKVDVLATELRALWVKINDTHGASMLPRMEAKQAVDGVRNRLLFAVRTRPPPKESLFDDTKAEEGENAVVVERQKNFMMNHFRAKRVKS
jgi:hypothetical protein